MNISNPRARIAKSAQRLPTGWTVRGRNLCGGEIFRAGPDRHWGPPNRLYSGYQICFPGVKRSQRGVDHSLPSSTEVTEKVEIYLNSLSGPSWLVLGRNLLYVGSDVRSSKMYYRHEKFFKHLLRILVNICSTASITIKNKKKVTL